MVRSLFHHHLLSVEHVAYKPSFREGILPQVLRDAIPSINLTVDGKPWLTDGRRHSVW